MTPRPKSRLRILFIMITLVIDAMGIGLIMPVMPDLIRELRNTDLASAALCGGVLSTFGPRAPFYAAAALAAGNFTFGDFILPETVTDAIRRPFEWRRANPLGAFKYIDHQPN